MAIEVVDTLEPINGQSFAVVKSANVSIIDKDSNTRTVQEMYNSGDLGGLPEPTAAGNIVKTNSDGTAWEQTQIKTINNTSLFGSGNIEVQVSSDDTAISSEETYVSGTGISQVGVQSTLKNVLGQHYDSKYQFKQIEIAGNYATDITELWHQTYPEEDPPWDFVTLIDLGTPDGTPYTDKTGVLHLAYYTGETWDCSFYIGDTGTLWPTDDPGDGMILGGVWDSDNESLAELGLHLKNQSLVVFGRHPEYTYTLLDMSFDSLEYSMYPQTYLRVNGTEDIKGFTSDHGYSIDGDPGEELVKGWGTVDNLIDDEQVERCPVRVYISWLVQQTEQDLPVEVFDSYLLDSHASVEDPDTHDIWSYLYSSTDIYLTEDFYLTLELDNTPAAAYWGADKTALGFGLDPTHEGVEFPYNVQLNSVRFSYDHNLTITYDDIKKDGVSVIGSSGHPEATDEQMSYDNPSEEYLAVKPSQIKTMIDSVSAEADDTPITAGKTFSEHTPAGQRGVQTELKSLLGNNYDNEIEMHEVKILHLKNELELIDVTEELNTAIHTHFSFAGYYELDNDDDITGSPVEFSMNSGELFTGALVDSQGFMGSPGMSATTAEGHTVGCSLISTEMAEIAGITLEHQCLLFTITED